jgi:hypothetical protein
VAVEFEAVQLDYETLGRPEGVDLVAKQAGVYGRAREAMLSTEKTKAILQWGAGGAGSRLRLQPPDNSHSRPAPCALAGPFQLRLLEQPKSIGFLECSSRTGLAGDLGQVEQSPGD